MYIFNEYLYMFEIKMGKLDCNHKFSQTSFSSPFSKLSDLVRISIYR